MGMEEVGGGFVGDVIENQNKVLTDIAAAINGRLGPEQQMIAAVGVEITAFLLSKNSDYGSAVFKSPALAPGMPPDLSVLVRLSDKLSRINELVDKGVALPDLAANANPETAKPAVKGESLADSLDDFLGYWLLRKAIVRLQKFLATNVSRVPLSK